MSMMSISGLASGLDTAGIIGQLMQLEALPQTKLKTRVTAEQGVVSALHHVPTGQVWTPEEIARRQAAIGRMVDGSPSGLAWEVVESLPVSEAIKVQGPGWREHVDAWTQSLRHLHDAGLRVICYNFMPVLDWTRTDLAWPRPTGALR